MEITDDVDICSADGIIVPCRRKTRTTTRMPSNDDDLVMGRVLKEENQQHGTRSGLFVDLNKELGRPMLSFFTSFVHPVSIEGGDVDMIEGCLQTMDLSNGLAIMLSSPGGDGLAAERIVNICRQYSGTNEYWLSSQVARSLRPR